MAGRPAAVLLHLGPGLANGLANLHNARRARTPVVVIVGAHATGHVRYDAPLQSDIEALARTVSGWVHTSGTTRALAQDAMRAVAAAQAGQIATLVLPADVSWSEGGSPRPAPRPAPTPTSTQPPPPPQPRPPPPPMVDCGRLRLAHAPARRDGPDRARPAGGQPDQRRDRRAAAGRDVSRADGARRRGPGRRPAGLPGRAGRSPAGRARPPHPGRSPLPGVFLRLPRPAQRPGAPGCPVTVLAEPDQDAEAALEELADEVAAGTSPVVAPFELAAAGRTGAADVRSTWPTRSPRRCPNMPSSWTRRTPRASRCPRPWPARRSTAC